MSKSRQFEGLIGSNTLERFHGFNCQEFLGWIEISRQFSEKSELLNSLWGEISEFWSAPASRECVWRNLDESNKKCGKSWSTFSVCFPFIPFSHSLFFRFFQLLVPQEYSLPLIPWKSSLEQQEFSSLLLWLQLRTGAEHEPICILQKSRNSQRFMGKPRKRQNFSKF